MSCRDQELPMAADDAIATVSLPWLGQRPAETYEQLCSSLLALDDAVEEVFGRVEKRCASENQKLQKLEERIASAQERARRITGSSAATVVLAAARYPAPTQQPDFERLFYDEAKLSSRAGDASKPRAAEAQEAPAAQAERRRAAAAAAAAVDPLDEYTYSLSLRPELAANYAPDASEPPTVGSLPDAAAAVLPSSSTPSTTCTPTGGRSTTSRATTSPSSATTTTTARSRCTTRPTPSASATRCPRWSGSSTRTSPSSATSPRSTCRRCFPTSPTSPISRGRRRTCRRSRRRR